MDDDDSPRFGGEAAEKGRCGLAEMAGGVGGREKVSREVGCGIGGVGRRGKEGRNVDNVMVVDV